MNDSFSHTLSVKDSKSRNNPNSEIGEHSECSVSSRSLRKKRCFSSPSIRGHLQYSSLRGRSGESSYRPRAHTERWWWLSHIWQWPMWLCLPPILDIGPLSQLLICSGIQRGCVLLISGFNEQRNQCTASEAGKEGPRVPAPFRCYSSSAPTMCSCKDQIKFHLICEPFSQLFKFSGISSLWFLSNRARMPFRIKVYVIESL